MTTAIINVSEFNIKFYVETKDELRIRNWLKRLGLNEKSKITMFSRNTVAEMVRDLPKLPRSKDELLAIIKAETENQE